MFLSGGVMVSTLVSEAKFLGSSQNSDKGNSYLQSDCNLSERYISN